jgi:hypothetical protein
MGNMKPLSLVIAALIGGASASAWAGAREASDLQREIATQRSAAADLDRLDEQRSVTDESTLLRTWLDEAAAQLAKEEFDKVREVIARCIAQAELIRQKTSAAKLTAQMREREAALKRSREKLDKTRRDLEQARVDKRALEMSVK